MKTITLEISLKPFYSHAPEDVERVCSQVFHMWRPLVDDFERVCILLWVGDGSEILEFKGDLTECFDWGRYIGGANCRTVWDKSIDPLGQGLHTRSYLYRENPPKVNYLFVKQLIAAFKQIGNRILGKPILVGATFDPGPEFATSAFKYEQHPEILKGDTLGEKSFVCCYSTVKADTTVYAGFPNGIEEDIPFGTFFGRQADCFLKALDYDYLWLSNGFGFGSEAWGVTGAVFDSKAFDPTQLKTVEEQITRFWHYFRKECKYPLQSRGTNLTVGIDRSTDGVNFINIYREAGDMLPPPNSPWAALDGNFGMELAGYLSRISELPDGENYMFRYYLHDPWWMNSPWCDRYEGCPHDIYLPLAAACVNEKGRVLLPSYLNILTVDNSLGDMPLEPCTEMIPHMRKALKQSPDQLAPFLWVYPYDEYHAETKQLAKMFFEDYLITDAINTGFPLNTVMSTSYFYEMTKNGSQPLPTVIVTPVPTSASRMNQILLRYIEAGGKVILYGALEKADENLLQLLGIRLDSPISGELEYQTVDMPAPGCIYHNPVLSDGTVNTVALDENTQVIATAGIRNEPRRYAVAVLAAAGTGKVFWLRGTNQNHFGSDFLLTPDDKSKYTSVCKLFLKAAEIFGFRLAQSKRDVTTKETVLTLHRHDNAFYFSGYTPDTTTAHEFSTEMGVPLFLGNEVYIEDSSAAFHFPRAWSYECRTFVKQQSGSVVSCREQPSINYYHSRRVEVKGLLKADVLYFPTAGEWGYTDIQLNTEYPNFVSQEFEQKTVQTEYGPAILMENITGTLLFSNRRNDPLLIE